LLGHSTFKSYVFGAEGYYEQKIVQGGANCKDDLSWCSRFRLKEPVYPFEQAWGMRSLLDLSSLRITAWSFDPQGYSSF